MNTGARTHAGARTMPRAASAMASGNAASDDQNPAWIARGTTARGSRAQRCMALPIARTTAGYAPNLLVGSTVTYIGDANSCVPLQHTPVVDASTKCRGDCLRVITGSKGLYRGCPNICRNLRCHVSRHCALRATPHSHTGRPRTSSATALLLHPAAAHARTAAAASQFPASRGCGHEARASHRHLASECRPDRDNSRTVSAVAGPSKCPCANGRCSWHRIRPAAPLNSNTGPASCLASNASRLVSAV